MRKTDILSNRPRRSRETGAAAALILVAVAALVLGAAAATLFWNRATTPNGAAVPEETAAAETGHTDEHADEEGAVHISQSAMDNVGLRTATAQIRSSFRVIHATGVVGPDQTRLVHLRPLARGRIEEVFVALGQQVRRSDPLVTYDNIELGEVIGQYVSALATLREAEARAAVALESLRRAENLVTAGAMAQAELDRRRSEHQDARSAVDRQRAEIALVDEKLHRFGMTDAQIAAVDDSGGLDIGRHREMSLHALTAPFDATVLSYDAVRGETVDIDRELLTLADLSTVWVLADVYERDIAAVQPGGEVRIRVSAYPDEVFTGRIAYIGDALDPATRTLQVRSEVDNAGRRLKLEMFASIEISAGGARPALMIPAAAVQQVNGAPVAFVMEEPGEFHVAPLLLGAESGGWVEVIEGLAEGDVVAAEGSFYLKSTLLREQLGGGHAH